MTRCPNCDAEAPARYCPSCGQDNSRPRLDTRSVLSDAFQNMIGWDTALGRTLRGMWVDPGGLAADYVAGHRRRYVSPARFALLSLALWLLVMRLLDVDPMETMGMNVSSKSGGEEGARRADAIRQVIQSNLDLFLYLSLPLRALLFRLFFRRSERNLAECLVLVLYVAGFGYLIGIGTTLLVYCGFEWALPARILLSTTWSLRAAHTFFERTWPAATWRVLGVSILHMFGTIVLFGVIAVPWVLLRAT